MKTIDTTTELTLSKKNALPFFILQVLSFLFSFHVALTAYINSSFVGTKVGSGNVGILYVLGSILTIIGLLFLPKILRRFGNYVTIFSFVLLESLILLGLAATQSVYALIAFFVMHISLVTMIRFNTDIFIEHMSDNKSTGQVRTFFTTINNAAWLSSPIIAGFIIGSGEYWKIYLISAITIAPVLGLLAFKMRDFKDPFYDNVTISNTVNTVWNNKNLKNVFSCAFILNFFYSWMIIYTPIYLNKVMGFSWSQIGIILTIMLIPFIVSEIPLGRIADKKYGEKEIMTIGFAVMSLSTLSIIFINEANLILWAGVLFATRIGASAIEAMTETYFFKQIDSTDAHIISLYRNMAPLAYIVGPTIATIILIFAGYQFLFVVLSLIVAYGMRTSLALVDTK